MHTPMHYVWPILNLSSLTQWLPNQTMYLLSLLVVTTFLLQPPTASPNLGRSLSAATPYNEVLYHIFIFYFSPSIVNINNCDINMHTHGTVTYSCRGHLSLSSMALSLFSTAAPSPFQNICSSIFVCLYFYSSEYMHVYTHAWCHTCSMSSSLVSIAPLLRYWLIQHCGFLTNHGDLLSSLMPVCLALVVV